MTPRLRALVLAVTAIGTLLLVAAIPRLATSPLPPVWAIALAAAALFAADIPVLHVRFGHQQYSFTWSEAAIAVGLVLLPSPWLRVTAFVAVGAAHLVAGRAPVKVLFNATSAATGAVLARQVLDVTVGSDTPAHSPEVWIALAASAFVFFLWNNATVAAAVAFSQGVSFPSVYRKGLLLSLVVWGGNTALGITLVAMAATRPALLAVFPLVFGVLCFLYRSYLRAMEERDTWELIQRASRELLVSDAAEFNRVVSDRARELFKASFVELLLLADGDEAAVIQRQWDGDRSEEQSGDAKTIAAAYWGRIVCEQEPFELSSTDAPAAQRAELASLGLANAVVAPLIAQNRCLGALRIGFAGKVKLCPRERQVFNTFANHVSAAAHNIRLFEDLRHQALHDPLTGLPNRTLLLDRLAVALRRSRRTPTRVALLFFDLDRFKVINDSLGHHVGDQLLVEAAARLTSLLRPGDTATRFGGDEFIVLCEDIATEAQIREIGERILEAFAQPFTVGREEVFLAASAGIALARVDGSDDPTALIRDADAAMYRAKERGRSRCEIFDADMRATAVARLETETDLRRAIDHGDLTVHYQPFVCVESQTMVGVEALVRWNHPTRGTVMPGDFIPLAEETGLVIPLGRFVLREATRQLALWQRAGLAREFYVAVNLSSHQLADPALVHTVADAIGSAGADAGGLCLEITESAVLADVDASLETLRELRGLGVRIALDDFGTGYSSLSYLHSLPVDILKIDRSFVGRLGPDPRDRAIVAGMIDLAHAIDLEVVAEGVETPAQLSELAAMGCDVAQGFYFARAQLPAQISKDLPIDVRDNRAPVIAPAALRTTTSRRLETTPLE